MCEKAPQRIGMRLCQRYVIFRTVADGGMGRVYQALDEQAQRSVAMKILHPEVAGDNVALERFKRELEVSTSPDIRQPTIGAFADAFGRACGLEGDHRSWAGTPEALLCAQIAERLPARLEEQRAQGAQAASFRAMDAMFRPQAPAGPLPSSASGGDALPTDHVIMGLPPARPAWFWPAIGGGALLVVALLAFLNAR